MSYFFIFNTLSGLKHCKTRPKPGIGGHRALAEVLPQESLTACLMSAVQEQWFLLPFCTAFARQTFTQPQTSHQPESGWRLRQRVDCGDLQVILQMENNTDWTRSSLCLHSVNASEPVQRPQKLYVHLETVLTPVLWPCAHWGCEEEGCLTSKWGFACQLMWKCCLQSRCDGGGSDWLGRAKFPVQ